MLVRSRLPLFLCLALPLAPAVAAEPACIDADRAGAAIVQLAPISAGSEELVRLGLSEGVSGESVYLLTRQMMLLERVHRVLVDRDGCDVQQDALGRDLSIMKRVFVAFTDGDPELHIEAMKSEQSQALLAELNAQVAKLDEQL